MRRKGSGSDETVVASGGIYPELARASAIIATSPNYVRSSSALQENKARCHIIPFGIPVESFECPDPKEVLAIRNLYGPRIVR